METHIRELSRRADKGDADALAELFGEAERLLANGDSRAAANTFRDSAIAYRIAAFREKAHREAAELQASQHAQRLATFMRWIEANPRGVRALPLAPGGVSREDVQRIILGQLLHDPELEPAFAQLCSTLSDLGMEFYSPGGSFQRRAVGLANQMLGLSPLKERVYLDDVAARICLDLIVDAILLRAGETPAPAHPSADGATNPTHDSRSGGTLGHADQP